MEFDKTVEIPIQAYRLADLKCLFCEESFTYFGYLITHVNMAHPQNCYICDDCGVKFNKKRDLAVHFRSYHRKGGYPCDQCPLVFENFCTRRTHRNNVHFRKCSCCSLRFTTLSLLKKHISAAHPNTGSLTCEYCAKLCQSLQGLRLHKSKCRVRLLSTTNDTVDSSVSTEPKKKQNIQQIRQNIHCILNMSTAIPFKFFSSFSCFYCSKKFVEFDDLKQHTVTEHPICDLKSKSIKNCKGQRVCVKVNIASLQCKLCCQPMENLDVLIDHLISEHSASYDKSVVGCLEPFRIIKDNIPCPQCPDRTFRYFGILQRHMNSDHSNNNKICDFCGRTFKNVINLKVHISHSHSGSAECNTCGVKFKNQWCLARHRAKSHDVKNYKCPKCPEFFKSQYDKQKHLIKVHDTGHKCEHCGKMFTRNSFMKDHIRRTHLKEKNVPCNLCGEKFFDNYLLRLHKVKHDGERKFTCSFCGKAFYRKSNLHTHTEMHNKYGHAIGLLQDIKK
ncbi:zinc finger protein 26-like [Ostrinia furnacalis]|uniref:zinc finger protein 26-like n=1 Tax=Ostrinia furnacalis TaxID=93504 RepID=UPI00103A41D7|nr:zinc finger protein 26-like [Ostrinia furnacalis]